jgi:hypothetical protein
MSTNLQKSVTSPLRAAVGAAIFGTRTFRPGGRSRSHRGHRGTAGSAPTSMTYRITDRLHEGRTVYLPCHEIVTTVSTWLAELGAQSPLVEDLARAIRADDWPTAYAIGDCLSVDVTSWA